MWKKVLVLMCVALQGFAGQVRILSLDGGGVRGAATLKVLQDLEAQAGARFHDQFDVFAGTSTGSMIALALAAGLGIDELIADYETMSEKVFSQWRFFTLFRSEYDPEVLRACVVETLKKVGLTEDACLGDLKKKVVIPTVSLNEGGRWKMVIRENFSEEGKKTRVIDAVMESTAAPTYFPSEKGCIDGGMAMNDPSLAALMTAYEGGMSMGDFRVFSVGTGYDLDHVEQNEGWGIGQWLTNLFGGTRGTIPLVEVLMDVAEQIPGQVCSKLLGNGYKRFDFPLQGPFALDDYEGVSDLLDYVEKYISSDEKGWSDMCQWLGEF